MKRLSEEFKGQALIAGRINMSKNDISEMIGLQFPMVAVLRSFDDEKSSTYHGEWKYENVKKWLYEKVYDCFFNWSRHNINDSIDKYVVDAEMNNIDL